MADASTHQTLYRYVPDGLTPRERTARRAEEIRDYYTAGHYRDLPGDVTSVEPAILALLAEIDASRAETEALRATAARQAGVIAAAREYGRLTNLVEGEAERLHALGREPTDAEAEHLGDLVMAHIHAADRAQDALRAAARALAALDAPGGGGGGGE